MGSKERRDRSKAETRQKIMDAARHLFASEGLDAVSMRRVAEAVEYSPTAIYVHFKDKDDLFHQLVSQDFDRLSEVFRGLADLTDPVDRLRQLGRTYIRFAAQFPHHYRLMFMTPHMPEAPENQLEKRGNPDQDGYAFLRHCVGAVLDAGKFRKELTDVELLSQVFWSAAHGVASLEITKSCDTWIDWRGVEPISALALDGLLAGLLREPTASLAVASNMPVATVAASKAKSTARASRKGNKR